MSFLPLTNSSRYLPSLVSLLHGCLLYDVAKPGFIAVSLNCPKLHSRCSNFTSASREINGKDQL